MKDVSDIDGSQHYSLENARLKAEQDRKMRVAEAKKQTVTDHVTCINIIIMYFHCRFVVK